MHKQSNQKPDIEIIKRLPLAWAGMMFGIYFILGETSPDTLTALGVPVLVKGLMAYVYAVIVILIGDIPLLKYVITKNKSDKVL